MLRTARATVTRGVLAGLGLLVAVSSLSGCSAFRGSRRIDMTPFAENTSLMFAEAAKLNRPFRMKYLKPYANVPETAELARQAQPLREAMRGLAMYSNQVVALSSSPKPDREKNRLLAEYLDQASKSVTSRERLATLGLSAAALDSVFVDIRGAENFREGINAASPLVNTVVVALLDGLDQINAMVPPALDAVDAAIESKYADKRTAYVGLTSLQARYLIAATWLYEGISGNAAAVDSLLRVDPSLAVHIPTPAKVTPSQLTAAEKELSGRLERIATLIEQMAIERATYVATKTELEDWRIEMDQKIRVARDMIVLWGQSHRNLGLGVPVPPLINMAAIAGSATKAVPIP